MTEVTSYQCDRCRVIVSQPEEVMHIVLRPSDGFSLATEHVHLCAECEKRFHAWLTEAPK